MYDKFTDSDTKIYLIATTFYYKTIRIKTVLCTQ